VDIVAKTTTYRTHVKSTGYMRRLSERTPVESTTYGSLSRLRRRRERGSIPGKGRGKASF
jgi:hypothetical protein